MSPKIDSRAGTTTLIVDEDKLKHDLEKLIVRANSWDELFSSKAQEQQDFEENLLGDDISQYRANKSLQSYQRVPSSEGDIHIITLKEKGYSSRWQKLVKNGNVIITYNYPKKISKEPSLSIITPNIGNINHPYTQANTVVPSLEILREIGNEEIEKITGIDIAVLSGFIKGKPAYQNWETILLNAGHLPQRIGHQIYSNFVLEAQSKLMATYPHLFSGI
jgi:hypothetical protein